MKLRLFISILAIAFVFGLSFLSIADDDEGQQDSPSPALFIFETNSEEFSSIEDTFPPGACAQVYVEEVEIEMEFDDNDDDTLVGEDVLEDLSDHYMELIPTVILVCEFAGDEAQIQAQINRTKERLPSTGEPIRIKAKNVVKFKAGKKLKDSV